MEKRICLFLIILNIIVIAASGCFKFYREQDNIDESLSDSVAFIYSKCPYDIKVNAYDFRENKNIVRFDLIVRTEDIEEQFEIVNSAVHALDDYLERYDELDGNETEIRMLFKLPRNEYSGVPGDDICIITNIDADGTYANHMICIYPCMYGYISDTNGGHYDYYVVPDVEVYGIHILYRENMLNEHVERYLAAWPSIDTVILQSTDETKYGSAYDQSAELQSKYPGIEFIAR